jgi:hypothetical protein
VLTLVGDVLAAGLAAAPASPAGGAAGATQPGSVPSGDFVWQAVRVFLVLGVVVLALLVVARLLSRGKGGLPRGGASGGVTVVGACQIEGRRMVYLVRVAEGPARGEYLVGSSEHGLHSLGGSGRDAAPPVNFETLLRAGGEKPRGASVDGARASGAE